MRSGCCARGRTASSLGAGSHARELDIGDVEAAMRDETDRAEQQVYGGSDSGGNSASGISFDLQPL